MVSTPKTIDSLTAHPPDSEAGKKLAEQINARVVAVNSATRTRLYALMNRAATEPQLLRVTPHADMKDDLQSFKNILQPAHFTDAIRQELHDRILTQIGTVIESGTEYSFKQEFEPIKQAFTPPMAPTQAPSARTEPSGWRKLVTPKALAAEAAIGASIAAMFPTVRNWIGTAGTALPEFVSQIPLIGAPIVNGINAAAAYFSKTAAETGLNAYLAKIGVAPAAGTWILAGLGIPAALWLAGHVKRAIQRGFGKEVPELRGIRHITTPIWESIKTPFQLLTLPFKVLEKTIAGSRLATSWTGRMIAKGWNNFVVHPWQNYIAPAMKPTLWGIGAGAIGAGILAPYTGGSSLIVGGLAYLLTNYFRRKGMGGGGATGS